MALQSIQNLDAINFLDTLVSLSAALILGTLIGAERQYRQRTAGLRTNALVALGRPPSSIWPRGSRGPMNRCA